MKIIDSHIHLDQYQDEEIKRNIIGYNPLAGLVSVSTNLNSCIRNLSLSNQYEEVHAGFGFHPEQKLPDEEELQKLFNFMDQHKDEIVAVGEVGLPYYLRKADTTIQYEPYIELLESFIHITKKWNKPINLHAVYEDAEIVCSLLEKHSIRKAHFHWFKGEHNTIQRLIQNGFYISVTPDVIYEKDIQQLVKSFPLEQIMIETDGPWPFEGPFKGKITHPSMMEESIKYIAGIKNRTVNDTTKQILYNTKHFYCI